MQELIEYIIQKLTKKSVIRYLVVGTVTFFLEIGSFILFTEVLSIKPIIASLLATLIALIFNFTSTNFWTFGIEGSIPKSRISKYMVVATFNYFINNTLMAILLENIDTSPVILKISVILVQVIYTYILYKYFVFKSPAQINEKDQT